MATKPQFYVEYKWVHAIDGTEGQRCGGSANTHR